MSVALRAAILGLAALLVAWPLTTLPGLVAALAAAVVGTIVGRRTAAGRLRALPAILAAGGTLVVGLLLARAIVGSPLLASLLGPPAALGTGEVVRWLSLVAPVAFVLRFLTTRHPTAAVLEVVAIGTAFAAFLAPHREGMVHRPHGLGDWAWSRGIDPAWILLGLGAVAMLMLAASLVRDRRPSRLPLHLGLVALLAVALLVLVRVEGLPAPDPAGDLGLTGDPEEGEDGEGTPRGGGADGDRADQLGDLEFRDEYGNSGGESPVAVVVLHDDWTPPSSVFYFRQSAFSQYNGRRLVVATRDDVDGDLVDRFPSRPIEIPVQPPPNTARRPLRTTTGLLVDHVRPFALDAPARLAPVENPDPMRFQRAFEAISRVRDVDYREMVGRRPGHADWSDVQWRHYTEGPSDPRYREMAETMTASLRPEFANDPLGQALAIKAWLDRNGIYSRRSGHAGAEDPTASFLFGDRTGYCVHFAHAATYLLRSLGLPARVAAGYAVSEASRAGGSAIMIRGLNAHAWPEIYLEGLGWVVVDPAPEQSLDQPTGQADPTLQRMLGEMLRQPSDALEDPEFRQRTGLADLGKALARILAVLLTLAYGVKAWRRLAPSLASAESLPRVGYRAALDRLAEAGWSRRPGESRERFAARVGRAVPSFRELTGRHLGAALGSRSEGLDPSSWRRLRRELGPELRTARPAWRRVLGWLDPIAWWRSR